MPFADCHLENLLVNDRHFFRIAGITFQIESDLPMREATFSPLFKPFAVDEPGNDTISIRYHFGLPELNQIDLGEKVGEKIYLSIYQNTKGWIYIATGFDDESNPVQQVAFADPSHSRIEVFFDREDVFEKGNLHTLSFYPNDMLLLTRILADRRGCMFHSSGVILDGKGYLYVGHSGAGKSTMVKMLKGSAEILCDDRNIVREEENGFRIHGTWNHGEIPIVSSGSAPLKAIFLLKKETENRIRPVSDNLGLISRLIACTIKPLSTADWWNKTFSLIESMVQAVPCHSIEFDLSGGIADVMRSFDPAQR